MPLHRVFERQVGTRVSLLMIARMQGRWFVSFYCRPIGLEIGRENDVLG
jgi:hypothetical protein